MAKMKLDNTKQEADVQENAAWDKELRECLQSPNIREMVMMITDNTQFLQDAQLQKTLQSVPREKADLMQVKHVFKALGIESARDIRVLLHFFVIDQGDQPIEAADLLRQNPNTEMDLVSEVEVAACLKRFLDHRNAMEVPEDMLESNVAQARPNPMSGPAAAMPPGAFNTTQDLDTLGPLDSNIGSALHSQQSNTHSMPGEAANLQSTATMASGSTEASHAVRPAGQHSPLVSVVGPRQAMGGQEAGESPPKALESPMGPRLGRMATEHGYKNVWELAEKVIPPPTTKVWKELHRFQIQYNAVLQERADTIAEVDTLREQNRELKMLLNQYLTSKVNGQLYVPPTATIARVDG